jgi:hypothetical protein
LDPERVHMEEHKVVNLARTTTARDLQRTHLICWRYISVLSFYGPLRFDIVIVVHMKQPNCAIYTRARERESGAVELSLAYACVRANPRFIIVLLIIMLIVLNATLVHLHYVHIH